jgi:diguanylate cyclase (GGDEF)-like protein/PAS domain S-box-containing protein
MTMIVKSQLSIKEGKKRDSRINDFPHLPEIIMSHMGVGVYVVQDGTLVYTSSSFRKLTGYSDTELVGNNPLDYLHLDDRAMVREKAIEILKGKHIEPYKYRFIKKNGKIMWVMEMITSIIHNGRPASLGSFMDITESKRMEDRFRQSEEKYRNMVEQMVDSYFEADLSGHFTSVNDAECKNLGYTREELLGMHPIKYMEKENFKTLAHITTEIIKTGIPVQSYELEITRKDGTKAFMDTSISLIRDLEGNPTGLRGIARDITERKLLKEKLQQSEERYRTIMEEMEEWYFETDLDDNFLFCNEIFAKNLGYPPEELTRRKLRDFIKPEDQGTTYVLFHQVSKTGKAVRNFLHEFGLPDGRLTFIEFSIFPKQGSKGELIGFRGVGHDITERKRSEEKIEYLATHDVLTGLPNRLMFSQLLNHAIQAAQRYKRQLAVFFIDLDRFKIINDTLGHEAGDMLLQEIATRLRQTLRAVDVIARLGGDEFVILIEEVNGMGPVATVARTVLSTVIKPMTIMDQECRITASIGISIYPKDGEDEQSLMKKADIAMYFAKEEGKNNYQFYSKGIKSQSIERLLIETNLRQALKLGEFYLHYQAKLNFKTGAITGVEALLRWQNPSLGSVPPQQLIPVAEETGLIVPIGRWVLKTACAQNVAWQRQGLPPVCMAVNLSLRQLTDAGLIEDIKTVLEDSGMSPDLLELEITESMVMQDPERMIKVLSQIKGLGVRLAIDDFGTGYSSLAQLRHFPVDTLKVDRAFIRNIPDNSEDKAITEAIIAMGKTLSLTVVAEGVETQEQMDFLQERACDEMQGFYLSKPVVPEQFAELLRTYVPTQQR